MKKLQFYGITAVLTAMLLAAGCGNSSVDQMQTIVENSPAVSYAAEAPMAPMEAAADTAFSNGTGRMDMAAEEGGEAKKADPRADRKLVKRANMDLEAEDFDPALASLLQVVEQQGGYIESQEIYGNSLSNRDGELRWANINARIPAEKLNDAMSGVGGVTNVVSKSENVQDISDTYFDSDARLKSLRLQEERLLAILEKAEKLEDVITLEQALSQTRYEIESLTASLRRMDSQVQYSYLSMHLQEVQKYTEIIDTPRTFGDKLADAFRVSGVRVTRMSESFLLGTIENLPTFLLGLLFWGILVWIVVLFVRFILKKTGALKKRDRKSFVPANTGSAYKPLPEQPKQEDKET